jgi:hypothetical protein
MAREEANMLIKMYENGNKMGFTAEEFDMLDIEMYGYVEHGWMRVVNVKSSDDGYELVYKLNDFYEILDKVYKERLTRLNNDKELIKLIKHNLDPTLVNRCRPAGKRIGRPPKSIAKKKRDAKKRRMARNRE